MRDNRFNRPILKEVLIQLFIEIASSNKVSKCIVGLAWVTYLEEEELIGVEIRVNFFR